MASSTRGWSKPLGVGPSDYPIEFRLTLTPQATPVSVALRSSSHFAAASACLPRGCLGAATPVEFVNAQAGGESQRAKQRARRQLEASRSLNAPWSASPESFESNWAFTDNPAASMSARVAGGSVAPSSVSPSNRFNQLMTPSNAGQSSVDEASASQGTKFAVGARVVARFHAGTEWVSGHVTRVVVTGKDVWYDVTYDSKGECERALPRAFLKPDPDAKPLRPGLKVHARYRGRAKWFGAEVVCLSEQQPWLNPGLEATGDESAAAAPHDEGSTGDGRQGSPAGSRACSRSCRRGSSRGGGSRSGGSSRSPSRGGSPSRRVPQSRPVTSDRTTAVSPRGQRDGDESSAFPFASPPQSPTSSRGSGVGESLEYSRDDGMDDDSSIAETRAETAGRGRTPTTARSAAAVNRASPAGDLTRAAPGISTTKVLLSQDYAMFDDHALHHLAYSFGGGGTAADVLGPPKRSPSPSLVAGEEASQAPAVAIKPFDSDVLVYDLRYDDGRVEKSVPRHLIRRDHEAEKASAAGSLVAPAPGRQRAAEALALRKVFESAELKASAAAAEVAASEMHRRRDQSRGGRDRAVAAAILRLEECKAPPPRHRGFGNGVGFASTSHQTTAAGAFEPGGRAEAVIPASSSGKGGSNSGGRVTVGTPWVSAASAATAAAAGDAAAMMASELPLRRPKDGTGPGRNGAAGRGLLAAYLPRDSSDHDLLGSSSASHETPLLLGPVFSHMPPFNHFLAEAFVEAERSGTPSRAGSPHRLSRLPVSSALRTVSPPLLPPSLLDASLEGSGKSSGKRSAVEGVYWQRSGEGGGSRLAEKDADVLHHAHDGPSTASRPVSRALRSAGLQKLSSFGRPAPVEPGALSPDALLPSRERFADDSPIAGNMFDIEQVSSSSSWSSLGYAFAETNGHPATSAVGYESTVASVASADEAAAAASESRDALSLSERFRQKRSSASGRRSVARLAAFQASNLTAADGVAQPLATVSRRSRGSGDKASGRAGHQKSGTLGKETVGVQYVSASRGMMPTSNPQRLPSRDRSADAVPATRYFSKAPDRERAPADLGASYAVDASVDLSASLTTVLSVSSPIASRLI